MARLLEFPMPTMAVFNGTAIANGLFWGLCHDQRIMNDKVGFLCLSELKLGVAIPKPYIKVTAAKLNPSVCLKYFYAIDASPKEAVKDGVIDDTYSSGADLQTKISAFVKRYAPLSTSRAAIKMNKYQQF